MAAGRVASSTVATPMAFLVDDLTRYIAWSACRIFLRHRVSRIGGDSEARGDGDLNFGLELERRVADRAPYAVRDRGRLLGIGLREDDAELVAAEADDLVDAAHGIEDPLRDLLQRARAGEMAEEVVDGLEVVEVEEDDAEDRAVAARALDLLVEV